MSIDFWNSVRMGVVRSLVLAIRCYQFGVRPLLVGQCRFHPSCSEFTIEALRRHGLRRGMWMSVKRIARCQPFSQSAGLDPVE